MPVSRLLFTQPPKPTPAPVPSGFDVAVFAVGLAFLLGIGVAVGLYAGVVLDFWKH